MGLGLSPFVVAGARDQMLLDEQTEWQREDQQFRRGQREREVKRAAVADELMGDQMADYRDERAFTRGMRDVSARSATSSRFDMTTALENFARSAGRTELADKFRADRENGNIDIMKRVTMAAAQGADATRIAAILNEGRPTAERIDPAAIQIEPGPDGRARRLVMRGPQGRPVPIDLQEWAVLTGLSRPQNIDIKDNVMTVANGDGSQSVIRLDNGRMVWERNPNHVPDAARGPGRGAGGTGGGSGAGGGSNAQVPFENALRDAIKDFPQFVERDATGAMRGINPAGQRVLQIAASLSMGSRQGQVSNGVGRDAGPASFESPTEALRIASDPSGQWKDVELEQGGRRTRVQAWVIRDPGSGGEVAYFPNNPIRRDVDQNTVVLGRMRQSPGFSQLVDQVRQLANVPGAERFLDEEFKDMGPGAGRALLSYVRDLQRPQDQQTMPIGEGGAGMQAAPAAPGAATAPSFGQPGGVSGGISRAAGAVAGVFRGNPPQPDDTAPSVRGVVGPIGEPGPPLAWGIGPEIAPRFRGGPQGTPPDVPRDWRSGIPQR
ncbi:MAG: hypothetical protein K2W80_02295 [Burkholderiales bacterium]|nr:hypothetical protein [Burkholderiales bacterium]